MFIKAYKIKETAKGSKKPYVLFSDGKLKVGTKSDDYSKLEDIFKGGPYIIGVDGSGSSTGVFLFGLSEDKTKKIPLYALNFTRSNNETFVEFRVCYKRFFRELLKSCKVTRLYYEEPVVDYFSAVPVLYSLRTVLEEILVEDSEELCMRTKLFYVSNSTWKKWLRVYAGDKAADYPENPKEFARALFLDNVELCMDDKEPALALDVTDAFALGFISAPAFVGLKDVVIYESPIGEQLSGE